MRPRLFRQFNSNLLLPLFRSKSVSACCRKMSVFTQKRNPITGKSEWDIQHEDYDYHQEIARSSFADMLHDSERNKKYQRALQMAIHRMQDAGKPANVLDIGTGTGLLAIMAVHCGADSVVACEAFKPMAECCLKILKANRVEDKITVIPKRSTELTVGENGDMKQKANILVTEVFDTELIGEGALETFTHAHKYLLEKDCIVVPDSAVVYVQIMDSTYLWKWNKVQDLEDEDLNFNLKSPQKMLDCAGSAAVHDLQMSQLRRHQFIELSEPIPVFHYDWSGKNPLEKRRVVKHKFKAVDPGTAHVVFMWWELNMDQKGKIVLSCAPWWCHPAAKVSGDYPQDSIPWRDHWMQGVYYFPKALDLERHHDYTLVACQDEYSLWFYLENNGNNGMNYPRPVCDCGIHMSWSRTHIANLNDHVRNKIFLNQLKKQLIEFNDPIILDLNGSSLVGLMAAKLGAKSVYILEDNHFNMGILRDYMDANAIQNVKFLAEEQLTDSFLRDVSIVTCNPDFSSAILPWENLKYAHLLYQFRKKLSPATVLMPELCTFYAMPVEFLDLHKIRIPLGRCEGIDMSPFDRLIENSRGISDAELEAQPLWEYPCWSRGKPRNVLEIDMHDLKPTYACNESYEIATEEDGEQLINGFVIWAIWKFGMKQITTGLTLWPNVGDRLYWDPYSRQAVKILKRTYTMRASDQWCHQVAVDLESGQFNLNIDLAEVEKRAVAAKRRESPVPLR